jgi:hypothetical protein
MQRRRRPSFCLRALSVLGQLEDRLWPRLWSLAERAEPGLTESSPGGSAGAGHIPRRLGPKGKVI